MKKPVIDRFRFLLFAVTLLFALVVVKLGQLQILQNDFWRREAWKARTMGRTIPFERGWIMDRRMTPLAETENTYDLRFTFGQYRKDSAVGQISMIYYILNGERPDLAGIYGKPEVFVDAVFGLSPADIAGQGSALKRRDLRFYLERLLGPSARGLFAAGGDEGVRIPFSELPTCGKARERILDHIRKEKGALTFLEREIGLKAGTLLRRPASAAVRADARVLRRLGGDLRQPEVSSSDGGRSEAERVKSLYRLARKFHAQVDYEEKAVLQRIPHEAVMHIALNEDLYPGFYIVENTKRFYPPEVADLCPNLIGRVGEPSPSDLEKGKEQRRRLMDLSFREDKTEEEMIEAENLQIRLREIDVINGEEVGILGLERLLEPVLRGKRGYLFVERDRFDRTNRILESIPPVKGRDVVLTIDAGLQAACERVLDGSRYGGAITLMDPRTGAVLALATCPRPTRRRLEKEYGALKADPRRPLLQRAINGWNLPPPGSVFKLVTAIAALEEGRATEETLFTCNRFLQVGRTRMKCLSRTGHGTIDMREALVLSCNIYFYCLSRNLDYDIMFRWAKKFGFGEKTGFLDPSLYGVSFGAGGVKEARGALKLDEKGVANLMRFCIGQGAVDDVTPLQVARMVSGIATGSLPQPFLFLRIGKRDIPPPPAADLGISQRTLDFIRDAMRLVTVRGTARPRPGFRLNLVPFKVAGKTGTAQVGKGSPDHAWFAGFLPYDAPRIAFAVFVESCGRHGGEEAAPILQRFLEQPEYKAFLKEEGP